MSNSTTTSIYSAALMDHNAHPDYKYELEDATYSHDGINASCGDEMTLYLKVNNDTNVIEEAKRLSGLFIGMIQGNELSDEDKEDLDEAAELQSISRMPARVKCAELAWRTLNGILAERDKELAAK